MVLLLINLTTIGVMFMVQSAHDCPVEWNIGSIISTLMMVEFSPL